LKIVCQSLGWKADPPSDVFHHVHIKAHVEGWPRSSVSLSYGRYPNEGRITVTAYTSHDSSIYRYGEKHLSITIAATRPADQIVKEIQRRFVPAFLENAKKAEEIQKRRDAYDQRLQACLVRLKGEALDDVERANGRVTLHLDSVWGTVQYGGDDEVGLDFHGIPMEKAERILTILREPALESSHDA
jgi:hypothetical protein